MHRVIASARSRSSSTSRPGVRARPWAATGRPLPRALGARRPAVPACVGAEPRGQAPPAERGARAGAVLGRGVGLQRVVDCEPADAAHENGIRFRHDRSRPGRHRPEPAGTWAWKDEDDFAEAIALGVLTDAEAAGVRAEGERGRCRATRPAPDRLGGLAPDPGWAFPSFPTAGTSSELLTAGGARRPFRSSRRRPDAHVARRLGPGRCRIDLSAARSRARHEQFGWAPVDLAVVARPLRDGPRRPWRRRAGLTVAAVVGEAVQASLLPRRRAEAVTAPRCAKTSRKRAPQRRHVDVVCQYP